MTDPSSTPEAREAPRPWREKGEVLHDSPTILLVESSRYVASLVSSTIDERLGYPCEVVGTRAEVEELLADPVRGPYLTAVVSLELPDAPDGEIVDRVSSAGIPTIVLTGTYDEGTRQRILEKAIVDYYLKEQGSLVALCESIQRLTINPRVKILVVDDSRLYRSLVHGLLKAHRFDVLVAEQGAQALELLEKHPDTTLVITDYEMDQMNGIQLLERIRERYPSDEMAVLGFSTVGTSSLSAAYLKHGADDFLPKPFENEEFYCRIYRCVRTVEQMRIIKRAAYTDALTGMYNRSYFFTKKAPPLFEAARKDGQPLTVAMMDIDFFKKINDTYGHAGGDVALVHLAGLLGEYLSELDVVARFGGEEFCALALGLPPERARQIFETLRGAIEASMCSYEGQEIRFTLSIGVALAPEESLDATINRSDELLYEAKEGGRNRVVME